MAVLPRERAGTLEEIRREATPERLMLLAEVDGELAGSGVADRSDLAGHLQALLRDERAGDRRAQEIGPLVLGPPLQDGKGEIAAEFLAGIDNARFRRMVRPGDRLSLEAVLQRQVRGIGKYGVTAAVDGEIVAEADLMAAMRIPADAGKER